MEDPLYYKSTIGITSELLTLVQREKSGHKIIDTIDALEIIWNNQDRLNKKVDMIEEQLKEILSKLKE